MKNIYKITAIVLLIFNIGLLAVQAQVPNAINFQAIARDADGDVMANTPIMVQLTILDGGAEGTQVYKEVRSLETNGYGSFSFQIGVDPYMYEDDFSTIQWETGNKYMQVDYDPTASLDFSLTLGTIEFATVPYAFATETVAYIDMTGVADGDVLIYNTATGKFEPGQMTAASMEWNDILNVPNFATVATSGDYSDLTNLPTLFDGQYSSLTGTPTIPADLSDLTDNTSLLFSGSYNDLTNTPTLFDGTWTSLTGKPTFANVATSGDYSDLTGRPTLFSGSFTDLTNKPTTIAGYGITDAFDGTWASLTGKPTFATVATSGDYFDLSNTPGNATTSTDGLLSSTDKTKLDGIAIGAEVNVNADWNAASGDAQILNKPTITDDQTLAEVLTESNDGGASQIKNIADPTDNQDAATKAYVDVLESQIEIMQNSMIAGGLMVKDYDGNVYGIVEIGTQVWMAEDLRVTTYPNGTPIPHVTDNTDWANLADDNTSDAYSFYNNDNTSDYGALYTYAAAIGDNWANDNATGQGVCPDGWHLPTDAEWTELTDYLGGESVAGGKMKETGTSHWTSPNTGATNSSGFSALPGGYRSYNNGAFYNAGNYGYWWSATEYSGTDAWHRDLFYYVAVVARRSNNKSYGFSVRCVRDN